MKYSLLTLAQLYYIYHSLEIGVYRTTEVQEGKVTFKINWLPTKICPKRYRDFWGHLELMEPSFLAQLPAPCCFTGIEHYWRLKSKSSLAVFFHEHWIPED
jgi:hypothetical protein